MTPEVCTKPGEAGGVHFFPVFAAGVQCFCGVNTLTQEQLDRLPPHQLAQALEHLGRVLGWLEGSEVFAHSHGAHSDAVEARKFMERVQVDSWTHGLGEVSGGDDSGEEAGSAEAGGEEADGA